LKICFILPLADKYIKLSELRKEVADLIAQVSKAEEREKDLEKEQEDLLVLLDEVTNKRKRDKVRLKEAGLEASEDEAEEEDEDEEDE
jgi:chromosome segregation ATPase